MSDCPTGLAELAQAVADGDRRALAQAITLAESTRSDHRDDARALLELVGPIERLTMRLGISGAPGAGKSLLIEALGLHAIDQGRRVAVLAIDPSSARSGGSILGDKTRMADLSRHQDAFIRPSPSSGTLGGVARRTREALLLCEAAGFDLVLIETVGVGQSEVAVADLVDLFVLVVAPGGGDELQGIKRGIMELADLIVVNKADGAFVDAAQQARSDLQHALHLLRPKRPGWVVPVLTCSALTSAGVPALWQALVELHTRLEAEGLTDLRAAQSVAWMWNEVTETLVQRIREDPGLRHEVDALEAQVAAGELSASAAAHLVLTHLAEREERHAPS